MQIKDAIVTILSTQKIATQEELAQALAQKGLSIKQSSISRQFKNLGVYKALDNGKVYYKLPLAPHNDIHIRNLIQEMSYNEALVVIKTNSGAANLVGDVIDKLQIPEILGSIAGDNTLFITPVSISQTEDLFKNLKKKINF